MFLSYASKFIQRLRISRPWRYKIPLIMSFTYFLMRTGSLDSQQAWNLFLASICTAAGFAGFGYFTNDLADYKKDIAAAKENMAGRLHTWTKAGILAIFLSMVILPWLYLPLDMFSVILIIAELSLFILYACTVSKLSSAVDRSVASCCKSAFLLNPTSFYPIRTRNTMQ